MLIRDYRRDDFDTTCEIDRLCFEEGISYTLDEMALWLDEPGVFALIAEDDSKKQVAGFVLVRKYRVRPSHIITIDVLPRYRRSGTGKLLMDAAHDRLKKLGATRVRLEAAVDNEAALTFYKKLGYSMTGRIPRYYLDRTDAFVLTKDL